MPSKTGIPLPAVKGALESRSAGKLAKPVKAAPTKKKPALSDPMIIDSSDEDTEMAKSGPKAPVNGTATKNQRVTSTSESESEESESSPTSSSDSGSAVQQTIPIAKRSTTAIPLPQQTPKSTQKPQKASPIATISTATREDVRETHSTEELRPVKPYRAPPGYKKASDTVRSGNVDLLERSALAGKQLWYFSAPASVDLSMLQELSAEQLNGTQPVLKQDNGEYTLHKEPIETEWIQIILPSGECYGAVSTQILASYKLQHKVTIPSSTAGPSSHHAYSKPKRQQPAGLRTRWRPAGAVNSDAEHSEADATDSRPTRSTVLKQSLSQSEPESSAPAPTVTPSKKRRDREGGDSERKKEKKRKKEEQRQAQAAAAVAATTNDDADRMDIDPTPNSQGQPDASTPEGNVFRNSLETRDPIRITPSQEKKKHKKKKDKHQGETDLAPLVNGDVAVPKVNGKTPIPLPDLPSAESPEKTKKKKKKEKDKTKEMTKDKTKSKVKQETKEGRRVLPEIVM